MTESKSLEINFDDILLSKYEHTPYREIIETSLTGCKKIFLTVYNGYNSTFNKIYHYDLEFLRYYLSYFRHLDKFFEREIVQIIKNALKKLTQEEVIEALLNLKLFFVDNEKDFNKKINLDKKTSDTKRYYLGIVKDEIRKDIELFVFYEAEYFLSVAKNKKYILDPFRKNYDEYSKIYLHYSETGEIMSSIRKVKKEYKGHTAISDDPYYQRFRQFITANKNLKLDKKLIEDSIKKQLKEIT